MKKPVLLICLAGLFLAVIPLMAQSGGHMVFYPPVQVTPGPQNSQAPTGILPQQFRAAYGFNQIPNQGQGMTIALVDAFDAPNITSDLAYYANYFHLAPCNFQKVKVGNPPPDSGWALEISLDVEQACALAPKANIILVEAASNYDTDLFPAVQVAYSSPYNATAVSMSWGGGEDPSEATYDSYFRNIVNGLGQAVSFFASSGDGGHGTIYPSTSPYVISVGGTRLTLASATPLPSALQLNYGNETAWSGSGGGVSPYEPQMSWQNPACATWSTTYRCAPDISSVAYNIPVYDTYGYGGWVSVMGTSISSPDWAAFVTLVNSGRSLQSPPKAPLSQLAYDLYQIYYSGNYLTDFHDITTGTNGSCGSQCTAVTGYDLVTGIGTFKANNLYWALLSAAN
ncbi:MAG TPA: S53 family peptidase [Terriglobales bacterium]|nr:S53 family peptidase [Terriglobales bacterium]